ncbi:response regulator [Romboutsia sp. CE17]|uniref:ATP-binding protein n=1 Tax=Romboutsia sp. CE17 TaxID=2724150 RepID=UPI001442A707|nr:ATP-binding protein [Romboutsia sp. CE17]QJA07488.1 response regulator [Romboutsia sp. CE17]
MKEKKIIHIIVIIILTIISAGVINTGLSTLTKYKTESVNMQKEQLQIIAQTLSEYIKEIILHKAQILDVKCENIEFSNSNENFILIGEDDNTIDNGKYINIFKEQYGYTQVTNDIKLVAYDDNGKISCVLIRQLDSNISVGMIIDLQLYYKKFISKIKVGKNGYIVVKNSDGIILMHPEDTQLGIKVIEGREELYPDLDLTSLKELFNFQSINESGVKEYNSYWWTKEEITDVKKIAAHSQVNFASDYIIVSAVTDYDDIYKPLEEGYKSIFNMIFTVTVIILVFLIYIAYLIIKGNKNREEILYLRELNDILEETRRKEETMLHQQRLQIMGKMTGSIAHEFNNLLTPIIGYAELLKCSLLNDSEEFEYSQEILKSADSAQQIIKNISKLSRKNIETVFKFIHCRYLFENMIKMLIPLIPSNIRLIEIYNIEPDKGILCNETQMYQAILNLCVNAFDAIGDKDDGVVEFCWEIENEQITIKIKDNGCGMEKLIQEQIFDPFFTTKINGQGTGLGLSMVDQIVHSHKGRIEIDSKVNIGTTFTLCFPLAIESKIRIGDSKKLNRSKIEVLILDDNKKVMSLLKRGLEEYEINADTCSGVEEALILIEENSYDIVLIDQQLSNLKTNKDGLNIAELIAIKFPHINKIIMVDQIKKEIVEAKRNGFIDEFIEKPVSVNTIIDMIYRRYNLKKN